MRQDVLNRNRRAIQSIAGQHGAIRVRVFGSVARSEQSAESDLDLIVELAPGRDLLDLVAIKQDLESLLSCPVDVVEEGGLSPYLRDRIESEALPL